VSEEMESKKVKIEEEIKKTLEQFDNAEKLTPDPYFYSKIQTSLKSEKENKKSFNTILKPALLIFLILFNLTILFLYSGNNELNETVNQQDQLEEILSGDLNINQTQQSILFEQ